MNRLRFTHPRRVALALLSLYVGLSLLGGAAVCWYDAFRDRKELTSQAWHAVQWMQSRLELIEQDARLVQAVTGPKGWLSADSVAKHMVGVAVLYADGGRDWLAGRQDSVADALITRKGWARYYEKSASGLVYAPWMGAEGKDTPPYLLLLMPRIGQGRESPDRLLLLFSSEILREATGPVPGHAPIQAGVESSDMVTFFWSGTETGKEQSNVSLMGEHLRNLAQSAPGIHHNVMDDGSVIAFSQVPNSDLLVWSRVRSGNDLPSWWVRSAAVMGVLCLGQALLILITMIQFNEMHLDRQKNRKLEELNRNLQRSNADLEQFAYIASHDLKEPLRNISGYVQLLQRRYEGRLDEDADTFIAYTVDGVQRLQVIINELLAYSRIGTGALHRQPVQTGVLVGNALGLLKGAISEAMASVEVKGTLPLVAADGAQIQSLFQNLISNAIKYRTPDIRPEIQIGYLDKGAEWAFYVRDNGIGIDPQYHQQIFGLFKRLHSREHYAGTGIGLSVCQRIVERHGGHIWVESRLGEGTCFWFTLPKSL